MELTINLNLRDLVAIRNCSHFCYMTNSNMLILHFDTEIDRAMSKNDLEGSPFAPKIMESDNSEYPNLLECYKLYIWLDCPIVLSSR